MEEFIKKGFPRLRIFDHHFEISREFSHIDFLKFEFQDLKEISYEPKNENWWKKLWKNRIYLNYLLNPSDPFILIITLMNDEIWVFETQNNYNEEFKEIIVKLIKKSGLEI